MALVALVAQAGLQVRENGQESLAVEAQRLELLARSGGAAERLSARRELGTFLHGRCQRCIQGFQVSFGGFERVASVEMLLFLDVGDLRLQVRAPGAGG